MATREEELDAKTRLTESLWSDPETRSIIEQAVVKKYPQAAEHIPAIAARKATEGVLAEAAKLNDETRSTLRQIEAQRALELARREIQDDPTLRIRPDELEAVEALMTDDKAGMIGSHRRAAQFYRAQQTVASPQAGAYHTMQVPALRGAGGDDYKWLAPGIGNPTALDQAARERAEAILNDFAAGRGDKWA